MKYWFKPYFIENWIIIADIDQKGVFELPYKQMQAIGVKASKIFSGRLHKLIIVNVSFFFYGCWKFVSKFLHRHILEKIQVLKKSHYHELFDTIDKT